MRRVLVVEDDPKDIAITRNAVVRAGLFPDCVSTGEEAISCLLKNTYAYILMEPSVKGLNVPLIISLANKRDRKAAIVVITKDSSLTGERRLREMGILYYMVKPANDLELSMVLQNSKSINL
ncbi:MAG: response regulator [Deltaproteobacteria bacterium]|nr:response regulator [Deltaproteobacteria bacterium]